MGEKLYSHIERREAQHQKSEACESREQRVGGEKGKKTIYLSCTPRLMSGEWKKVGNASRPWCLPRPSQLVPGAWAGGSSPNAACSFSSLAAWISFIA